MPLGLPLEAPVGPGEVLGRPAGPLVGTFLDHSCWTACVGKPTQEVGEPGSFRLSPAAVLWALRAPYRGRMGLPFGTLVGPYGPPQGWFLTLRPLQQQQQQSYRVSRDQNRWSRLFQFNTQDLCAIGPQQIVARGRQVYRSQSLQSEACRMYVDMEQEDMEGLAHSAAAEAAVFASALQKDAAKTGAKRILPELQEGSTKVKAKTSVALIFICRRRRRG